MPSLCPSHSPSNCRRGAVLLHALLLALLGGSLSLVNPGLQPKDLYERYRAVLVLRVDTVDAAHITCTIMAVEKGEFASTTVSIELLSAAGPDASATKGRTPQVEAGQVIVAFVGKTLRKHENEVLIYVGQRAWHEALIADPAMPQAWRWQGVGAESLVGTFNGEAGRFAEMMADAKAGRIFFPAQPLLGFGADIEVGQLPGAGRGIMALDLDGDRKLDLLACSSAGLRAWVQDAPGHFADRTHEFGLEAARGDSCSFADIDGDGQNDLLIGGVIWRHDGVHFVATVQLPADLGSDLKMAVFAEVNGDGWPDVVASVRGHGLRLLLNPGVAGGAFRDASTAAGLDQPECGRRPSADGFIAVGDWNGDSRADIYLGIGRGLILVQDAEGGFAPVKHRLPFSYASGPELAPGLTGAGGFASLWNAESCELAVATDTALVLAQQRAGRVEDLTTYGNEIAIGSARQLASLAEDLDMDGNLDLYTVSWDPQGHNGFHSNRGYGSFMRSEQYMPDSFPGAAHRRGTWGVAAADMNGDGANDLILCGVDGRVTFMPSRAIVLQAPSENPTWHQAKAQRTRIITVEVCGRRGVCGAIVRLLDATGKPVLRRVIASQQLSGCRGPDASLLAVREPGAYTLEVRYADGLVKTWPLAVDAGQAKHRVLRAERE